MAIALTMLKIIIFYYFFQAATCNNYIQQSLVTLASVLQYSNTKLIAAQLWDSHLICFTCQNSANGHLLRGEQDTAYLSLWYFWDYEVDILVKKMPMYIKAEVVKK